MIHEDIITLWDAGCNVEEICVALSLEPEDVQAVIDEVDVLAYVRATVRM